MSSEEWIILSFKIAVVCGFVSISAFVLDYTRLAPWWKNEIGRTIVVKDILLMCWMGLAIVSIFLNFNRLTSLIAAWISVIIIGAITPVMIWRIVVFEKIHKRKVKGDNAPEEQPVS